MKKTFNFLAVITLIAMVVVGCKKSPHDNEEVVPGAGTAVLYASTESYEADTRVHLEDNNGTGETVRQISTTWRNDAESIDKITIYNEAGNRVGDLTYEGEDNATSGKFSGDVELKAGDSYTAVYPSSDALTLTARNAEALDFAEQTQASQIAIINDAVRMKAEFEYDAKGTTITFENEMAIVSIDIVGQPNSKPQTLTFSNGAEDVYVINYSADAVSANSAIRTYIAVHPVSNTAERTLNFKLVYTNGLDWEFEKSTARTFEAGMIYTMPVGNDQALYISTAEELAAFRDDVNAGHDYKGRTVVLIDDITLSGEWTPIGLHKSSAEINSFRGTFDGGNHTISGLTITSYTTEYSGFFGFISDATIKNIKILEPQISLDEGVVGALSGTAYYSQIENCAVIGGSIKGRSSVGGLLGSIHSSANLSSSINSCYNTAAVSGNLEVGGIVGVTVQNTITITSCYNTGVISGNYHIAGIVGNCQGEMNSCYNVGIVSGSDFVGEIVGTLGDEASAATNCFYLSGTDNSAVGSYETESQVVNCIDVATVQGLNDLVGATDGLLSGEGNFSKGNPPADHLPKLNDENIEWEDPVLDLYISNEEELKAFRDAVNDGDTFEGRNIIVKSNISLTSQWTPIGNSLNMFKGNFDGGNHNIDGLIITDAKSHYQGLFGFIEGATIKNLSIIEPQILSTANMIGALVGQMFSSSTIDHCSVIGGSIIGNECVGGLVGLSTGANTMINSCYNTATVSGAKAVGGVAGIATNITSCYNAGAVIAAGDNIGGIAGVLDGVLISSYNVGSVRGASYIGGLVGALYLSESKITDCFSLEGIAKAAVGGYYDSANEIQVTNVAKLPTVQALNDLVGAANGLPSADFTKGNPSESNLPHLRNENLPWEDPKPGLYIFDEQDLIDFREAVNRGETFEGQTIILGTDITLKKEWIPISENPNYFKGTFDGGNHTISGLTITDATTDYQGLFGYVTDATIKNVNIYAPKISSNKSTVGALVAYAYEVIIENCSVIGGTISGVESVGGIVGGSSYSSVISCYSTATVLGDSYVGGIVGSVTFKSSEYKALKDCYNAGLIKGKEYIGGVVGALGGFTESDMESCYNMGTVTGTTYVGGIAGRSVESLLYCYNIGAVSGDNYVGGVSGVALGNTRYCYSIGMVTGSTYTGGVIGALFNPISYVSNCFYLTGTASETIGGYGEEATSSQFNNVRMVISIKELNDLVGSSEGLTSAYFTKGENTSTQVPYLGIGGEGRGLTQLEDQIKK